MCDKWDEAQNWIPDAKRLLRVRLKNVKINLLRVGKKIYTFMSEKYLFKFINKTKHFSSMLCFWEKMFNC